MQHIEGCERDQSQFLPARVDDYVHDENPVRFIDAFVDGLDLATAGFGRVQPKGTGRPGYDPADLLRLYIYGYLNRVRSSRRLEAETHRNLEVIWLLRGLRPDFKTVAGSRRDNRTAFKVVFQEFVLLCRTLDLYGRELVAVDGTRLKAVNSRDRNFTREKLAKLLRTADERLAEYLERLDRTDAEEGPVSSARAKALAEKIARLKRPCWPSASRPSRRKRSRTRRGSGPCWRAYGAAATTSAMATLIPAHSPLPPLCGTILGG